MLALRPAEQQVVVGPKSSLERTTLQASAVNWLIDTPTVPIRAAVQIRHRHQAAPATVRATAPGQATVTFDAPQIAITPGQAAVFYRWDDDLVDWTYRLGVTARSANAVDIGTGGFEIVAATHRAR